MRSRILGGIATLAVLFGLNTSVRAVGPIVDVSISPTNATLASGKTQVFTVRGVDENGATTDLTANSTFTTTDLLGTIDRNRYTAGTSGSWTVSANYNQLSSNAAVTVIPGSVAELSINPNSDPEIVPQGTTRRFTADGFDSHNNKVDDFTVRWSVEGRVGSIASTSKNSARFIASQIGSGRIVAKSGLASSSARVSVRSLVPSANIPPATNATVTISNTNAISDNVNADAKTSAATNPEPEPSPSSAPATSSASCKPFPRAAWVWIFIAYVVALVLTLYPIRKSRVQWWWIPPLVLTVVALWLYFEYRCYPVYPAWPYIVLLAGIVVTSWYNWQRGESQAL